ncbi:MAG: addiction module antidote protein [Hyphomicrobium sp.]
MVKTVVGTKPYDSADYLKTPKALTAYLEEALAEKDRALIAHAIGVAARAQGMSSIAKKTKLSRESLYRSLSADGNPELETLIKVLTELGLRLTVEPDRVSKRRRSRPAA